jgi:gelsolin
MTYSGKTYHVDCFKCGNCNQRITNLKAIAEFKGVAFHKNCFIKEFKETGGKYGGEKVVAAGHNADVAAAQDIAQQLDAGLKDDVKVNLEDSNVAGIGGKENRALRQDAAKHEAAWVGCEKGPGVEVWRIEKFQVKPWPKAEYGTFFRGDCYIVLHTYRPDPDAPKLAWDVYFWLGAKSSQDEQGTAAYKTVELDDLFGDAPVQHREVDGFESQKFLALWNGKLTVQEGGIESGFHHVKPEHYEPRLLHFKGKANHIRVTQVPLSAASLNGGDTFLLDAGLHLYEWHGHASGVAERNKCRDVHIGLVDRRNGRPKVHTIDQGDAVDGHVADFWKLLGSPGGAEVAPATPDNAVQPFERVLLTVSDAGGALKCKEVARGADATRNKLSTDDAYILDIGHTVFVWVGNGASKAEKGKAIGFATGYLKDAGRPIETPVVRVLESSSSAEFDRAWVD